MNLSRRTKIAAFGITVSIFVGVVLLFIFFRGGSEPLEKEFYRDRAEASNAIQIGWIPEFLPQSSVEIHEQHNPDDNDGIIAFRCSPLELTKLVESSESIPPNQLTKIVPSGIYKNYNRFFPAAILEGHFSELLANGYKFYGVGLHETEPIKGNRIQKWYLAINTRTGHCYIWYF